MLQFQIKPNLAISWHQTESVEVKICQVWWKNKPTAFYIGRMEKNLNAPYFLMYCKKYAQIIDEYTVCIWERDGQPVMHFSKLIMKAEIEHILKSASIAVFVDKVVIRE